LRARPIIVPANSKFGPLYNWYAATGGTFVSGWHVPTAQEVFTLQSNVGGQPTGGGHLKETGYLHWNSPNTGADNSSGFNLRGTGARGYDGVYRYLMTYGGFWTSNVYYGMHYNVLTSYNNDDFNVSDEFLACGHPIRLLCDSSTDPGFVDIDGYRYNTVKIGTQVWLAENLKAQHYADGSPIPEVTGNSAWASLTTPGLCAYNNDWTNV